ncbi:pilus assembly protein PilY [Acinetobacter sp. R933-2]|uniref:PilC/PilY family type IV pilus protein n=1 Tax=Acinetobacter sp. R933-2 TaxID=2746728 RepID=UPI0025751C0B|nr:PilC/PilY family type IV pilus protein [Acinetobacter sp. R933-2]MDM1246063.1 pilus assembly protein PilY [Acinetobacter sp. R933-2]
MKTLNKNFLNSSRYKVLVISIAAISTMLVSTSVTQASDIDIYQDAKSGDITLMFMLDVSGSMTGNSSYDGTGKTRIVRLKMAMDNLLNGTAKIDKLGDDKIIGLSTLGSPTNTESGAVLVPARRLDAKVGTKTQRQVLWEKINSLSANSNTPTGRSYATTISYLMGTSTRNIDNGGWNESDSLTKDGNKYQSPPSLTQTDDIKKCSGQGIYVLTDGEPNKGTTTELSKVAIGETTFPTCSGSSPGWDCIGKLNAALLDPTKNIKKLQFKTAVVGFGNSFNNIPKYDSAKSQAENLVPFVDSKGNKKSNLTNVQEAAYWGIMGEGGWYSGNDSADIVDSVNDFINNLSKEIPSVTTGSPTIPRDALNPAELQDNAYYQTFQPTPATNYQLWLGNLKKYLVSENGVLKAKNAATVFESDGRIKEPVYDENGNITSAIYDFWAKQIDTAVENGDENTVGSKKFAVRGGAWSQMLLGANTENKAERKLLTNRKAVTENGNTSFKGTGTLRQVQLADIVDTTYKNDPNRGYLWSLLGYNIDVVNPPTTIDNLKAQPNLRQMGAVMHSYPLLVTNKGKLEYNKTTKVMESTSREDYVLFGTTQGLLHVVDAETGVEKFAFVPNEMVENQKDAFRLSSVTNGGLQKLYYGVDGAWSLYTQYVVDSSGNLVVGKGRTDSQQGMQMAYGGLRMGGRSYYALDLSNINSPELKFHIDPATQKVYSGSSSTTFNQLQYMGQSWSKPAIGWVNWGGTRKRVMFVGGGYDAGGDDGDAHTNGVKGLYSGYENANYNPSRSKGAGIYMFDADNGDLLWWASDYATATSPTDVNTGVISTKSADLKYSVVSEIRTVDRDGDDLIDHLYFGDLGGQLFRIDLDNKQNIKGAVPKAPVKIFTMHTDVASPRFYDMPGFSLYNQNGTTFAVISQGSGNRSAPLTSYTSSNTSDEYDAIYNIYDKDVARRDLFNRKTDLNTQNLEKTNLGEITDLNRFENTILVAPFSEKGGWYYDFKTCTAGVDGKLTNCNNYNKQSEKVFGTPLAMNYKLYVSTFDSSKPGISGECGAGVKGESMLTAFCMPFGQCASKLEPARGVIGIGIHTVTVGGKKGGGGGSDGGEGECVGESCPPVDCKDESCPPKATGNTSATNYCINTSGRIALTVTGGFGNGEATEMCLIPQRWYEKLARKVS